MFWIVFYRNILVGCHYYWDCNVYNCELVNNLWLTINGPPSGGFFALSSHFVPSTSLRAGRNGDCGAVVTNGFLHGVTKRALLICVC